MELVLDAGPLIYLAKLDAFDAVEIAGRTAVVPPSVFAEAARPELAFRHPEIATIVRIREEGRLLVPRLDAHESELAADLAGRYGGIGPDAPPCRLAAHGGSSGSCKGTAQDRVFSL